ncbi:MAG: hypothetical protein QNJ70_29285 [Xenococcaceae cyanobacterium MO_207.B15]|nr:hypothetical protein [Xenococcaceae cyanobacterium MO_207.B15]
MRELAILSLFEGMPDARNNQGKRQSLPLCLSKFYQGDSCAQSGLASNGR